MSRSRCSQGRSRDHNTYVELGGTVAEYPAAMLKQLSQPQSQKSGVQGVFHSFDQVTLFPTMYMSCMAVSVPAEYEDSPGS